MPGVLRNDEGLSERDPLLAESIEYDVGGHELGQRGGCDAFVRIAGGQHLAALEIHEEIRVRGQGRNRYVSGRHLGEAQRAREQRDKDYEFHHCEAPGLYIDACPIPGCRAAPRLKQCITRHSLSMAMGLFPGRSYFGAAMLISLMSGTVQAAGLLEVLEPWARAS